MNINILKLMTISTWLIIIIIFLNACEPPHEKPKVIKENHIYKPSEDSNNVFWFYWRHRGYSEMDLKKIIMPAIDSMYKAGYNKNFEKLKYIIKNEGVSLDSLIEEYTKVFGKPFTVAKYDNGSDLKSIYLYYNYDMKYYLCIEIEFTDTKTYDNPYKIKINNIRNFYWFPFLINLESTHERKAPDETEIKLAKSGDVYWQNKIKVYKALDSIYKILNPDKNK